MSKQILFIQGGGNNGYEADIALVASLRKALGEDYDINYPKLQSDESASDFGWCRQIGEYIAAAKDNFILAGHSLGAAMVLKYLSENVVGKKIKGLFLLAAPFWSGDEDWKKGLKLSENFAEKLDKTIPLFFYHCKDDEEVPFSHFMLYRKYIAYANFQEIKSGGHRLNNDLLVVAQDIKSLK